MADNIQVTEGSGKTVATKEITDSTAVTREFQYVLMADPSNGGDTNPIGATTETAPATDTASSGLNGRLQRIAQRLTSLIALVPAALGQGTMAQSFRVVVASDQSAVPVSGTITANAGTNLNTSALALETGGNLAAAKTDLDNISGAVTGSKMAVKEADGDDVTQGALADAIVAAGATGSISAKLRRATQGIEDLKSLIVLAAGSAIIGKVGIDQTTPGTTDSVTVATAQGAGATVGVTTGTAVVSDANGTLQQYLRGIVKILADVWSSGSHYLAVNIQNATLAVTQSGNWSTRTQDGGGNAITSNSTTTSSKFGLDANILSILGTAPTAAGKLDIKSADGDQATIGVTTGAAVVSDATGTLQQYLRGLVKMVANVWDSTNSWLNVRRVKKDTFGTATAFTITLASLASSTVGVGRQSTLITSNVTESALISVKFTTGTTPTANSLIYVYLLRGDGTTTDDGAGASDAGLTVINAPLLGTIFCNSATSNVAYYGVFDTKSLGSLGPTFGIAIVNSTGATANATGGNFLAQYTLIS